MISRSRIFKAREIFDWRATKTIEEILEVFMSGQTVDEQFE